MTTRVLLIQDHKDQQYLIPEEKEYEFKTILLENKDLSQLEPYRITGKAVLIIDLNKLKTDLDYEIQILMNLQKLLG